MAAKQFLFRADARQKIRGRSSQRSGGRERGGFEKGTQSRPQGGGGFDPVAVPPGHQ